jgi:hypothetical protein
MAAGLVTFIRDRVTGAGTAGVTVELRKVAGDVLITSHVTDADGKVTFTETELDYKGPVYITANDGSNAYVQSSEAIGTIGPWRAADFPHAMRIMTDGVVDGFDNELAVTANGTNLVISVDTGAAFGRGLFYRWTSARTVTLFAGEANPRIDRIVLRYYLPGVAEEGRIDLVALKGVASATPAEPNLTQNVATYWEIPLASVRVEAGVTAIAASKVTDERSYSTGPVLAGVDATKIADGSVTNTEFQYINSLTSNAQTQISGKAPTVHTHAGTDIVSTVPNAMLGTGTANSSTYLRGDHTWATPPTGGGSHTHDLALIRFANSSHGYSAVGPLGSDTTVDTFSVSVTVGQKYTFLAAATYEGYAEVGDASQVQLGIQIPSQGIDWGSQSSSENESSPVSASTCYADVVASVSPVNVEVHARRVSGSGNCYVRSGHAWVIAIPANTAGVE